MASSVFIDKCPGCRRTLKVDPTVSGPLTRCPACGAVLKVTVPAPGGKTRAPRGDRTSEDTIGVLAMWVCGVGALVTIGSIIGVLAVGLSKQGTPAAPPIAQGPAPAPVTPPSAPPADANDVRPPTPGWLAEPDDTEAQPATQPQQEKVAVSPTPTPAPTREPTPRDRKPTTPPPPTQPPKPAESEPELPVPTGLLARLVGVRADVFSHRETAGTEPVLWRPAPLGEHYVFFTLGVRNPTPQPTQLFFDAKASSRVVRLTNASGESADALGQMVLDAAPPRQFNLMPLELDAREEVSDLIVAFVVPSHWREATLEGPGFTTGRIRIPAPDEGDGVMPDETVGWWRRVADQPFRVRYVNPVLAALADPQVERMIITTDGRPARVIVTIPYAEVSGTIEWPADDRRSLTGMIDLRRGGARLTGNVRFADRGRVLILYASDEPFEQIIYRKPQIE
jgi:hypothetical protein